MISTLNLYTILGVKLVSKGVQESVLRVKAKKKAIERIQQQLIKEGKKKSDKQIERLDEYE